MPSRLRRSGLALIAALSLGATLSVAPTAATAEEPPEQPTGQLPLTGNVGVHDPTMAYDEDAGLYVVASTHNSIRTAPTMEGPWTVQGNVSRADWTYDVPNSGTLWAPHLQKIGDTFYYYYSQSSFGVADSAIGVKTTKTPADPSSYVDHGSPIVASGSVADEAPPIEYNAIDPAVVQDTDGTWWMVWGSFWDGIVVQQLADDLVSVVGEPTLIASRQADDNPVEGPALFHRDGYYYLVLSWDKCCSGADSTYKVAVGRSKSITGPYVDQAGVRLDEGGGTVILDSRESAEGVTPEGLYRAPAGGDVYTEDGVNYFVYHAYRPFNTLGIRPMEWRDGWPSFGESDGGPYDLGDGSHIRLVSEAKPFEEPEVTRVSGPEGFGTAVRLNGDSPIGYVEMPVGIVSEVDEDFTIATWVKRGATFGNDWARLFDFGDNTENFMFMTPSAGATPTGLRVDLRTADGGNQIIPGTGNSVGVSTEWTHVAVSASGTTATLWVDGAAVRTTENFTLRPADLGVTSNNWIGRSQFSADPGLNATVDDFNIFSRELSPAEMEALTTEPGGGEAVGGGDVAWYRFDESAGPEVVDASASGNDATAVVPASNEDELQNPTPGTQCLTNDDGAVSQTECDDSHAGQVWRMDAAEDNSYRLAGGDDQCVALADASGDPGTPVVLNQCDPEADLQRWFIEDTGHGFLRFSSSAANLALEISNVDGVLESDIVGGVRAIRPIANMEPPQQWMPEHVADTARPTIELTEPAELDFDGHDAELVLDAEDDRALAKIVGNIYADGTLLKSTQSRVEGASAQHTIDLSTVVPGGLGLGDYTLRFNARDAAGNLSQTHSVDFTIDDRTRPEVSLVQPASEGPFSELSIEVDATDNLGLARVVANVYQDGRLVKSTQSRVDGQKSFTHTASVPLEEGRYTVKYNAHDLKGNVSATRTVPVTIDTTGPRVTVKEAPRFTEGADGVYQKVSFKLFDSFDVDQLELNGKVKDLTDNTWSDLNFVQPGTFGAVSGENVLVVHDVAGNTTKVVFVLE